MKYPFVTLDQKWIPIHDRLRYGQAVSDAISPDSGEVYLRVAAYEADPLFSTEPKGMQIEVGSGLVTSRIRGLAACLREAADALEQFDGEG